MGSKLSCIYRPDSAVDSRQVDDSARAARVVAADGTLRELLASPRVAVVSDVLGGGGDDDAAAFFVCNSDALSFDEHPPALAHGEPLRPGELYFVLPAAMRRRRLSIADMAALAVRASAALAGAGEMPVKPQRQAGRLLRRRHGGCGGSKKKVRVAPAAQALADDDLEGVLNEKLNEQTVFAVFLSPARGGAMLNGTSTAAARSPVKRALSLIEEDA